MHDPVSQRASHTDILKVVLIYAIFAGLWIVLSDWTLDLLISDMGLLHVLQTLKGWLFVGVTSLLLYFLLRNIARQQQPVAALTRHGGIVDWKPWQFYLFAAFVTLLALLLRESVGIQFSMRPMLIMLMFPIILSAALGGFGPGLLSTAIATLYAGYYFPPAAGEARFQMPLDLLPTGFMIVNGLLVSFLSKMLHEARYHSEQARWQAETSLAEKTQAMQLLDGIAAGSTDAIFAKDLQGHYLLFNEAAARNVGKQVEEVLGKDDTAIFKPEDAAVVMADDHRITESGKVMTWNHTLSTATGPKVFSTTQGPLRDSDGDVIGVFGIARDITAIKSVEEALRRERDRNQRYLDTAQNIMLALDSEGRITMLNRYGCELLGYRESELLGENWFKTCLPQPEGMESVYPVFQHIMSGNLAEANQFENPILCRDGSQRMISWHNGYYRNEAGNIVGTLSSGEDITQRKAMEVELVESEARYHSLFENSLDGVLLTTPEGSILSANAAAQTMFGYNEDELKKLGRSAVVNISDARLSAALEERARTGSFQFELELVRKDGTHFPADLSSKIFTDRHGGELTSMVVRDLTERKKFENELCGRNEELERFNRAGVGRELQMIELKKQVNTLSSELGREPPYKVDF